MQNLAVQALSRGQIKEYIIFWGFYKKIELSIAVTIPKYKAIKSIDFWVPPQPCGLMLTLYTYSNQKIKIDMLPNIEAELIPHVTPRRIYINNKLIELKSKEEESIISLLIKFVMNHQLGNQQGLAVIVAKEMISFFNNKNSSR